MRRTLLAVFFLIVSLSGCAAGEEHMNARAANENQSAHDEAQRALFARGYRALDPPPVMKMLTLRGVNGTCTSQTGRAATDSVEVLVGDTPGATTFADACALASGKQKNLSVRLGTETAATLLTQIPQGSLFAVAPSGKVTRYLLVGQVKKNRRVFAKGVSCCCDMGPPPPSDATFQVVVGVDPATDEAVVSYDTVLVTACDPAAPQ